MQLFAAFYTVTALLTAIRESRAMVMFWRTASFIVLLGATGSAENSRLPVARG